MLRAFLSVRLKLLLFMMTLQQTKTVICKEQPSAAAEGISPTCYLMEKGIVWCSHVKDDTTEESVSFLEVGVDTSDICETLDKFWKNPREFKDKFQLQCTAECTMKNHHKSCSCLEYACASLTNAGQDASFMDKFRSQPCPGLNLPKPMDFLFFDSKEMTNHQPDEPTLFARAPHNKVRESKSKGYIRGLLVTMGLCRESSRNTRYGQRQQRQEEETDPYKNFPSVPNTPITYPVENIGGLKKTKTGPQTRDSGQASGSKKRREEEEPDELANFPPVPGTIAYPDENTGRYRRTSTWPKERESSSQQAQRSQEAEDADSYANFPPVPGAFITNPHGGNGNVRQTRPQGKGPQSSTPQTPQKRRKETDPYAKFPPAPTGPITYPFAPPNRSYQRSQSEKNIGQSYADFPPVPPGSITYPFAPNRSFQRSQSEKNMGQSSTSQTQQQRGEAEDPDLRDFPEVPEFPIKYPEEGRKDKHPKRNGSGSGSGKRGGSS